MNREERVLKYINSSDDFVVNGRRYCENDFYNDVEDLVKENKKYKEVIDKAIDFIDCHFKEIVADEEAQELKSILKEVE